MDKITKQASAGPLFAPNSKCLPTNCLETTNNKNNQQQNKTTVDNQQ